jgi:hypothetical protein
LDEEPREQNDSNQKEHGSQNVVELFLKVEEFGRKFWGLFANFDIFDSLGARIFIKNQPLLESGY